LNVGPLVVPTSKADYIGARVPLPPKLFSHNDQQSYWQALAPEGASSGWAGRLTDLYAGINARRSFTGITAGGNTVLLAGRHVAGYRVGVNGSTRIELLTRDLYGSSACTALLRQLITQPREHLMEREMSRIAAQSIDADARLRAALSGVAVPGDFASPLAQQLKIVARIIAARQALGARRQVFFVSQNGYDNHTGLNDTHPALLKELGQALAVFQQALAELGVARQVTTFTASEFGRTLGSNGNGSDHGWGAHHFVLGGAVN
ncbi:Tat pathway signal protein, partial [Achromobacter xylosoxidans]